MLQQVGVGVACGVARAAGGAAAGNNTFLPGQPRNVQMFVIVGASVGGTIVGFLTPIPRGALIGSRVGASLGAIGGGIACQGHHLIFCNHMMK